MQVAADSSPMPYITEYAYRPIKPSYKRRSLNWLLISLMLLGLVAIALPFYPGFIHNTQTLLPAHQQQLTQAKAEAASDQPPGPGNWLLIPSIGVKTPIVEGSDVGILDTKDGVWHQTGSTSTGNFVLAGHRFKYLPPNQTTLYLLDKLQHGDQIVVWYDYQRYAYQVAQQETVGRNATQILNPTKQTQLTIYTCTDLNASHRLVVIATPQGLSS